MRELIFEDITFTNFKCHEELNYSFIPNRFSVITGNNGSGKTTIFDALCYALYDSTTKGIKGDNVIRKKSGKNLSVILKFHIDDDNYEIRNYRKHYKYGDAKFLFLNGKDVTENSRKATNLKISQILMPEEIFTNCLLFSQFINKSFTELTHSGQKEILDKILNLEKYDEYLELTNESIISNKSNIENYKSTIINYNKELFSHEELLEQNKKIKEEIKNNYEKDKILINNEISNNQGFIIDNQKNITEYLKKESEKTNITNELNNVNSKISEKREKYLNILDKCKNKYDELSHNQRDEVRQNYNNLNSKLQEEKQKIEQEIYEKRDIQYNLKEKTSKYIEEIKKVKNDELKSKLNKLQEKKTSNIEKEKNLYKEEQQILSRYKKNKEELQELQQFLTQDIPICATCKQEIKDEEHLNNVKNKENTLIQTIQKDEEFLKQRSEELEAIKNLINELTEKINQLTEEYDKKIQELIKEENDKLNKEIDKINISISQIKSKIEEYNKKIEENKKEQENKEQEIISKLKNEYQEEVEQIKIEAQQNAKDLIEKRTILEKQLESIEKEYTQLKEIYLKVNSCETTIKLKKEQLKNNEEKLKIDLQNNKNNIDLLCNKINEKKEEIKELENKIQQTLRKNEILTFWKGAFSNTGIKSILLDESLPVLNKKARELSNLTDSIKVSFDSQQTLKSGDMRDKFSINVLQTTNLSEFSELSAGETRMANIIVLLCLRHLMETIQGFKMNVLLLDEILDTLDQDNAMLAVNMIKKLSNEHCVVLVSHTLRNFIDADEELNL